VRYWYTKVISILKDTGYIKDTMTASTITKEECKHKYLPVRDTLDIVGGKWKLPIIHTLASSPMRFKVLQREVQGITARVLSKELKDLEENDLVKREVFATSPVTVEYSLTEYGQTLKPVVLALYNWGTKHRERIIKGKRK
jgi:DNA-binding HxlR family transcriptional regulator